ncbi:MAG: endolytic transglycosylase MltG [Candidatus Taylorbacteria bacterium]|nr:endolytic transglycosylase MltG [Candidatus Taylorbacteria bacterium]
MSGPLRYISQPEYSSVNQDQKPSRPFKKAIFIPAIATTIVFIALVSLLFSAPSGFPKGELVTVEDGETLSGMAKRLALTDAVRSPFIFKSLVVLFGGSRGLVAGDYLLERKESAIALAWRFSHGSYGLEGVRITIPEGTSSAEIAALFEKSGSFTRFDPLEFRRLAGPKEGYLFPDTYLFLPNVRAQEVVLAMLENFDRRIEALAPEIAAFGKSRSDVIKMASIIEEEARTDLSRQIIAGILWKRLDEGMPLQVDAAFSFVNGKGNSALLTLDDLKIDSPYNTYVYKGLPPTPISNPGLASIKATIHPLKTPYYFYLSDDKGEMHYAETHDGHLVNKNRYLR